MNGLVTWFPPSRELEEVCWADRGGHGRGDVKWLSRRFTPCYDPFTKMSKGRIQVFHSFGLYYWKGQWEEKMVTALFLMSMVFQVALRSRLTA